MSDRRGTLLCRFLLFVGLFWHCLFLLRFATPGESHTFAQLIFCSFVVGKSLFTFFNFRHHLLTQSSRGNMVC